MPSSKPSWDEYFMRIAWAVSTKSTCLRRQVGAVLVRNNHILSTGYNGAPRGVKPCETCIRRDQNIPSGERHEICMAVHAEQNAIIQAAIHGVALFPGTKLYCTTSPCSICAKMIINAGIMDIYVAERYPDALTGKLFKEAGVKVYFES